jgi:outer membrane immunogenic protein
MVADLKKILVGAVVAAAIGGGAAQTSFAADMPMKAAPVAIGYHWTGIYGGIHAGAGTGTKDWAFVPTNSTSHKVNGAIGGGQLGFNYQIGSWVFGVEGDLSASSIQGSSACPNTNYSCSSKAFWLATLTGRVGYAVTQPLLVYVKGGGAWAREQFTAIASFASEDTGRTSVSGWTIGGGLEYGFARNWSVKIEYDYLDFGTKRYNFLNPAGAVVDTADVKQQLHLVKAGLNYRFLGFQ